MEGISGRSPTHPLHAGTGTTALATLTVTPGVRAQTVHLRAATGVSEARPHTWRGEDNAPRDEENQQVRPAEASFPWREPGSPPARHERKLMTETGTNEARVLVRRREMAEVGPKHRAP